MAASSAKGLQMDKILNPPRDTLMVKTGISLPTVGGCKNWNSVADASGSVTPNKINNIILRTTKYYLSLHYFFFIFYCFLFYF